jgi:pimeloyl-ACP methyl ester carboxylesterase
VAEITTGRMQAGGLCFVVDEAGAGEDVALLLHGFPESRHSWRHQLPLLADLGWRAIAPDLRGYGESSRPVGRSEYRLARLTDDVANLFDAAGAKRRLLIGHDWGGIIAWAFAMEGRLPLDGLVAMNAPHLGVFGNLMRSSWKQRMKSWYMGFFQVPALPEAMILARNARAITQSFVREAVDKSRFPPQVTEVYRQNALIPGAMTAMINYYRANVFDMARFSAADVPVIDEPTLLIWGEADGFMGVEATDGYGPYVTDFTLRRLPDVSHWVQQEAPEAVNAQLAAWMKAKRLA